MAKTIYRLKQLLIAFIVLLGLAITLLTVKQIGLRIAYQDLHIQAMYQLPVSESLNGEQLRNAGRIVLGLIYNFAYKDSNE